VVQFRDKLLQALLTASDKIIAGKPNEEQYEVAVQVRVSALMTMKQLGDATAQKKLDDLLADLEKAGKPKLIKGVRGMLLMARMERLFTASPEDQKKFVADVKQLVGAAAEPQDASLMMNAVMTIETTGNTELAAATYRDFAKLFAASKEKQIQDLAPKLEGAANRMEMVGKKLDLEGNLLDGKPLKWDDYRGKVVLVEFWATWCGPCRMELPNIKRSYQAYHSKGFDVVGVSIDEDKRAVEAYVKDQTVPWAIMFNDAPGQKGFNNPLTTKLGVFGVPCSLLVDKEGKVLSLQARGPGLRKELEKLLGPPAADANDLPLPGIPALPAAPKKPS
jgi:thiol-disulfide isomerase/thioredoxin